jgi:hypothetical protein
MAAVGIFKLLLCVLLKRLKGWGGEQNGEKAVTGASPGRQLVLDRPRKKNLRLLGLGLAK